ncbi:hypothetical protein DSECCO2_565630 [anaerobic digester metagenome]
MAGPDVKYPFVHPGRVAKPGVVAHVPGQTKGGVRLDVARREGEILFPLFRRHFHADIVGDRQAQGAGIVRHAHQPGARPIARPLIEAFAPVGPFLLARAQKREGDPLVDPNIDAFSGLDFVIVVADPAAGHVDEAAFLVLGQAEKDIAAASLRLGVLALFLPEIAAVLFHAGQLQGEVEILQATAGNQADRRLVGGHFLHGLLGTNRLNASKYGYRENGPDIFHSFTNAKFVFPTAPTLVRYSVPIQCVFSPQPLHTMGTSVPIVPFEQYKFLKVNDNPSPPQLARDPPAHCFPSRR